MEKFEQILFQQQNRADDISIKYATFKKLPILRRTINTINKNLQELEVIWGEFYATHQILEKSPNYKETDYYKSNFAFNTQQAYNKYKAKIAEFLEAAQRTASNSGVQSIQTEENLSSPSGTSRSNPNDSPLNRSIQNEHTLSSTDSLSNCEKQSDTVNNTIKMPSNEFETESKKRNLKVKHLKDNIEKAVGYLAEDKSAQFFEQKLKQMEIYWQGILDSTDKMMGDDYDQACEDELSGVQEIYDNVIIQINERITTSNTQKKGVMKLPQINLKSFDGNYQNWLGFRDLYEQMIHNNKDISPVEKFTYLKTSINGDAAQLIKHMLPTANNYESAWTSISNRYNNGRRLVETYLRMMCNQPKVKSESAVALKKLHDTTLECIHAMTNLEIDTNQSDFLLNYIVTQKLDRETKRLYEQTLREPKKIQKFSELMQFIEERFHTLEAVEGERNDTEYQNERHVFNITKSTPKCVICKQQHSIQHCDQFKKFQASERYKVIKKTTFVSIV